MRFLAAGAFLAIDQPPPCPSYVLNTALSYLSRFDMRDGQRHVQTLTVALLNELAAAGVRAMTSRDPAWHRASFCIASTRAQAVADALRDRGVYARGRQVRVRISFQGYNGMDDANPAANALRAGLSV